MQSLILLALELSSQAGFSLALALSLILYLGFTDIGLLCLWEMPPEPWLRHWQGTQEWCEDRRKPRMLASLALCEIVGRLLSLSQSVSPAAKGWKASDLFQFKNVMRDFPGGSVVKALCFLCKGHRFDLCSGNKDPTCQRAKD